MQVFIRILLIVFIAFSNSVFAETKNTNKTNKNLFFKINDEIKLRLEISPADVKTFKRTERLIKQKNWIEALSWADSIKSENLKDTMVDYVLWKKYTNINMSMANDEFSNLLIFIETHQYLPNITDLKIKAESMYLVKKIPYDFVEDYFNKVKPLSAKTATKILISKVKKNNNVVDDKLKKEIIDVFYNYDFSNKEMDDFLDLFSDYLVEDNYAEKVERLLWEKKYIKANYLMNNFSNANRILYSAIMEINKNPRYINNILRSIPKHLRENELLLYTRFVYLHKNGNKREAQNILLSLNSNLKNPEKWWTYQKYYAREFLKDKDYKKAYFLAVNNNLKANTLEYAEAQWFAGWMALSFLERPKDAYYHFYNMYNSVSYPISKSRGAYWAGRAMEADNNLKEAIKWYEMASKYPLYFYGQLSFHAKNELLNTPSLLNSTPLPEKPTFNKQDEENVLNNDIVKIAYLISKSKGEKKDYRDLFLTAIKTFNTKGELSALFEVIKGTGDESLITKSAKQLTYKDVYFVDNLFPILNIINLENPNSHLVHALIKQESGFHISAESNVGAIGFMQLMPETAKQVAKSMNLKYNPQTLKTNPAYNILLGSYYINSLIKQFNGSQVLAIASYNAGPKATQKWIKQFGDPRKMSNIKEVVDWMESIGYSETRNYVQRIIEGSIVYEYILEKNNESVVKSE